MALSDRNSVSGRAKTPEPKFSRVADEVVEGWFKVPRPDGVDILSAAVWNRPFAFVIVDVREPKGEIEGAVDWASQFVAALRGKAGIEFFVKVNPNSQPSILVVGKRLVPRLRRKAHSAGCAVYDVDLPSNAPFKEPAQIVHHLVSLGAAAAPGQPSEPWTKDPRANPSQYYEPVRDVSAEDFREYLRFLNHDVT